MTRQQIRQCADIVRETVSARDYARIIGIPVNRNGFAQCFMHSGDHTGSLRFYDGRRGWHCFGCGASGDVIELAKQYYGLSFPQAIQKVAEDAGVELPVSGAVTVEQAELYRAAQQKRETRERQERLERQIDDQYYDTLGDYIEIERRLADITDPIYQAVQEANKGMFTDEEVAQARKEYAEHWKAVEERIRRGERPVPPWKKPGFKPHPITERNIGADVELTPELIKTINARNNVKAVLDDLEVMRRMDA